MPTGFTDVVENGEITDLRTFTLRCARAFGPCVMQREDSMDVLPVKREPTTYHLDQLKEVQKEARRLNRMTIAHAKKEAEKSYRAQVRAYKKMLKKIEIETKRYRDMLEKVNAWTPPSINHEELRKFMIQQLTISISNWTPDEPKLLSAQKWLTKAKKDNQWEIDYYTEQYNEEVKRCEYGNKWIDELYKSFGQSI